MFPSPGHTERRTASLSTPAFLRRFATLLLASILLLFLAGTALASIDAPRPIVGDSFTSGVWDPAELPDVALLISGVESADPTLERMVIPALRELPGVAAVTAEHAPSGRIALHLSLMPGAGTDVVSAINSVVASSLPDAHVALGGRTVADQDLLDRLNRGTIVAVVPVIVLLTALVAVGVGGQFGGAVGGTVGLSTLLGGLIGSRVAGSFDGTLATTAVPAVLVAVLVSTVLSLRLLEWFKAPIGNDQADAIRHSVRHLLPEMVLLFGGIVAAAILLELTGTGRSTASVVAVGGIIAATVTLGVLPAMLSTLDPIPSKPEGLISSQIPDGRDFPVAVLGGFACFLLGLGLFAIRIPSTDLLDESALSPAVSSRRVSEQLIELGGDPSSAILASFSGAVGEGELTSWSLAVSKMGTVGWVQTSVGQFVAGERVGDTDSGLFQQGQSVVAIVTPTVTARSEAAQGLIQELQNSESLRSPDGSRIAVEFSGSPVDAAAVASGASRQLVILLSLLSLAAGFAVLVLVGDVIMAVATASLRLLGLGAVLGVYRLVAGDVGAAELQVAALVLGVGVGLFEIGFLRRIVLGLERNSASGEGFDASNSSRLGATERASLVTNALHREGRAAMFGLAVTALCGLGFIAGDLDVGRRLGVAVAAAVVVEMLIGTWLLRPVILGQRLVGLAHIRTSAVSLSTLRQLLAPSTSLDLLLAGGSNEETSAGNGLQAQATGASASSAAPQPSMVAHSASVAASVKGRTGSALEQEGQLGDSMSHSVGDLTAPDLVALDDAELSVAELSVAELSVAELSVAELSVAELSVAEPETSPTDRSEERDSVPAGSAPDSLVADPSESAYGEHPDEGFDTDFDIDFDLDDDADGSSSRKRDLDMWARLARRSTTRSKPKERAGFRRRSTDTIVEWSEMPPVGHPLSATFAADVDSSSGWRRIVGGLLRSEFAFQTEPETAQLETVFITDTPLFAELQAHNQRLRKAGLTISGDGPQLRKVSQTAESSPVTLAITVDHPERRLHDAHGRLVGTRAPERRHGMLWLVQDPSGRYRIAEAVDLGDGDGPDQTLGDSERFHRDPSTMSGSSSSV